MILGAYKNAVFQSVTCLSLTCPFCCPTSSGWWFQPICKIFVKMGLIPQIGLNIQKYLSCHHLPVVFYKTFHGTPTSICSRPSFLQFLTDAKDDIQTCILTLSHLEQGRAAQHGNTRGLTKPCEPLAVATEMTRQNMNIIKHPHENPIC